MTTLIGIGGLPRSKGQAHIIADTLSAVVTNLNALAKKSSLLGSNILIRTMDVPDLWIDTVENTSVQYTYVSDAQMIADINSAYSTAQKGLQIGYYRVLPWEGAKIDLSAYVRSDAPQSFTDAQKSQARTNIGAIALTDVPVDIFTAEYDVDDPTLSTPYADVAAAYTAGKRIQVKAGFDYFPLKSIEYSEFCFTGLDQSFVAKKFICKTTGWEVSEIEFLTTHQSLSEYRKAANQDVVDEALATAIAGKYAKPSTGIPSSDMSSAVQNLLDKAGSALQEVPNTYRPATEQDTMDEATSDVIAAALAQIIARLDAIEHRLSPSGNLGKVNIDDLSVIRTFNNYTV